MTKAEIEKAVREIPLFSRLKDEQIIRLSARATVSSIPKKSTFFSEDSSSQGLHVLISGKVKLFKIAEDGKEQTIFVFGPGEPFCLCSVFSDGILPANMAALEDSEVLYISPQEYENMVREDPTILMSMMRVMSRRLKDAMNMIDSLSLKQVPSRLAAYFMSREKDGVVELDISHRELSKIIGITPEALSRTLKKMAAGGLLEVNGSEIRITDMKALELCGDGSCL
ncbi:Crp/Fnr family transcriptional regulator [Maridesulfovibrio sp.]|uniref:Crp/Fnr family transcriptional regulator n=1 Tax=Maridesulfovibrio sp. TaxID=2795000 RepID=UPI002A18A563|nr:Crp/Fnr family transcriptional regulator [Maridesulfovibrio sp.]